MWVNGGINPAPGPVHEPLRGLSIGVVECDIPGRAGVDDISGSVVKGDDSIAMSPLPSTNQHLVMEAGHKRGYDDSLAPGRGP